MSSLKIKNLINNSVIKNILFLLLISYPTSHLAAQEDKDSGGAAYKIVSPESEDKEKNFKLNFDKIDTSSFYKKAVLQILNKTTAKSYNAEVQVGDSIKVGQLTIKVNKCWQAPLDQKPDSRILLEIVEEKPAAQNINNKEIADQNKKQNLIERIFFGWMISSSPSISSLEHPIYDVTALNCKK